MKKILVADDNPDIVELLRSRLIANHYEVVTANNGVNTLLKTIEEKPDLIILDIKMPSGTGIGVYENMKRQKQIAHIPVIFITAYASSEIEEQTREMGAKDFIAKPFDADDLLEKVKKALTTN
jgi:CheY-like chemotaxis protein